MKELQIDMRKTFIYVTTIICGSSVFLLAILWVAGMITEFLNYDVYSKFFNGLGIAWIIDYYGYIFTALVLVMLSSYFARRKLLKQ